MKRLSRSLLTAAPLLVSTLGAARERPHLDALALAPPASASPRPVSSLAAPAAVVAAVDAHRGVPTFLWADRSQSQAASRVPEEAALEHLARHAARYGLSPLSLAASEVTGVHDVGRGGILVTLGQRIDGVELFHQSVKVLMDRELGLVAIGGNLHAAGVPTPKHGGFLVSDAEATAAAFLDLYGLVLPAAALGRGGELPGGYRAYGLEAAPAASSLGLRLLSPVRVKRVYFPLPDRLVPAYFLEISAREFASSKADAYAYVIAADDGRVLYRDNLTHAATFSYRAWADAQGDHRPQNGPLVKDTPYPAAAPNGSYPAFGPSALISIDGFNKNHDPWLPGGATESSGNNVDAYTDDDSPDGFSPGDVRASVTAPGAFDLAYDLTQGPQSSLTQRMASVTSVFYVTNWLHDWWYDSGFDEKGNNAQRDNYGRGGLGGDPLLAEAQNGAPMQRNNSDMSVFGDGQSPRMQMFVWDGLGRASLTLSSQPQPLAVGLADFGPQTFQLTGAPVLVDDGTAPVTDACEPIQNSVSGKIAVIDRGMCPFEQKAQAAQAAGAVGVILVDDKPGEPAPPMSGSGAMSSVTIPVLSLSLDDGGTLKAALGGGALGATLARAQDPDRDGTLDNTVVAHEWGHYLHLRNVACGSQMCGAESEGWGDFNALLMVVREGDDLGGAFALAQYATAAMPDDPAYFGIRRYPYSTDFSKNALTFKHITSGQALPAGVPVAQGPAQSDNAEVHAAGEIWASMLFEAYVALLKRTAGPNPAYSFDEARRRMSDYVVLGLKLAPVDPTFTEQRDAILAAAAAQDPKDTEALAAAFARRGAGTCAVSPGRDSTDFSGVVESFEVKPNASLLSIAVDDSVTSCDKDGTLDAGETGKVTVVLQNGGTSPLVNVTATVSSTTAGALFPSGAQLSFGTVGPFGMQTASVDVALAASVHGMQHLDLTVKLDDAMSCAATAALAVSPLVNYDEIATGAATDSVEAKQTRWALAGAMADQVWSRIEAKPGNHVWAGIDFPSPSDTQLVSPKLTVSPTDKLVLSFTHRHQFETSMGVFYDGAVIEVSSDAGKSWQDISMFGAPGYGGMIGDPMNQAHNALKGRQGFVDHNPSYPATDSVAIDLGTSLAGKTVQIRFRIATDDAQGAFGWELDDIGLTGITNAPFSGVVDDQPACGTGGPAGAGGSAGGGGQGAKGGASGNGGSPAQGGSAGAGVSSAGRAGQAGSQGGNGGAGGHAGGAGHPAAAAAGTSGGGGSAARPPEDTAAQTLVTAGGGCATAPSGAGGKSGAWLLGLAAASLFRRRRAAR